MSYKRQERLASSVVSQLRVSIINGRGIDGGAAGITDEIVQQLDGRRAVWEARALLQSSAVGEHRFTPH